MAGRVETNIIHTLECSSHNNRDLHFLQYEMYEPFGINTGRIAENAI